MVAQVTSPDTFILGLDLGQAVDFSALILIMASMGWAESCPS
jgi:hypothetical protein